MSCYDFAMGSSISVKLYGENAEETGKDLIREVKDLDQKVISRREDTSELAQWNKNTEARAETAVSERLGHVIETGLDLGKESGGAFDITLRPVLEVWGIEDKTADTFQVPEEKALQDAKQKTGTGELKTERKDEGGYTLSRGRKEIIIDLGALGKGYALDVLADRLKEEKEIRGAVIAVGGSVLVYGSSPDGRDFKVGIRDPEGAPDEVIGTISFPAGTGKMCVSTSGGYEKYIEKDGVRYHHIIDPATLRPADSGLASVTVVSADGGLSDGLSTACFILGEEKSKALLAHYGAEAVMIRADGSTFITDGLKDQVVMR